MTEKHAVFVDIDGTLMDREHIIPPENVFWLKKAQRAGHKVFINTGRSLGNIPPELRAKIDFFDGIVCGNGSHVIIDGRDIFKSGIEIDTLCKLSRYFLDRPELWCMFEGERDLFLIPDAADTRDSTGITLIESAEDFRTKYYASLIETVAVGRLVPEDFEELFKDELTVFRLEHYSDCVAKGNCKANGMLTVLERLSIPVERSIAIGDSAIDLSMLLAAGISVAVENAPQEIKQQVDFVTASNTQAGVAVAIEKILFSEG